LSQKTGKAIAELLEIMASLRDPDTGCPWDREQTFASIAPYTIEEAYEVADAIARGNCHDIRDELGDLLLQVVYHAQLAQEMGLFTFEDVAEAIVRKMVRRHPHVFGEHAGAANDAFAHANWEKMKAEEQAERHAADRGDSVLDGVPLPLPSLSRAMELQNNVARVGFDWPSICCVYEKLNEEMGELKNAPPGPKAAEEMGDFLFAAANLARHMKIEPENALRDANNKFERRFRAVEAKLRARGKSPVDSNLAEMDALWDEVKAEELNSGE
jgi:ATP diphosphatase